MIWRRAPEWVAQRQIGRGEAQSHRQENQQCHRGSRRQTGGDPTAMNGAVHGVATSTASAPVKKLPQWPSRFGEAAAGAREASGHRVNTGQVQSHGEQQPGHRGDKYGRGELKSPARRRAPPSARPVARPPRTENVARTPAV